MNENEIVTSSEMVVGPVHRRDVDSTFTCLASNSNMTQASRATVVLQMNRKNFIFFIYFYYGKGGLVSNSLRSFIL